MAIYFLQRLTDMAVKIGYSYQPSRRVNQVRTDHGAIKVLGVMEGDKRVEESLYIRFYEHCIGGAGTKATPSEWFAPAEELMEFISANAESFDDIEEIGMRFTIPIDVYNKLRLVAHANGVSFADMMRELVVTVSEAYPAPTASPFTTQPPSAMQAESEAA